MSSQLHIKKTFTRLQSHHKPFPPLPQTPEWNSGPLASLCCAPQSASWAGWRSRCGWWAPCGQWGECHSPQRHAIRRRVPTLLAPRWVGWFLSLGQLDEGWRLPGIPMFTAWPHAGGWSGLSLWETPAEPGVPLANWEGKLGFLQWSLLFLRPAPLWEVHLLWSSARRWPAAPCSRQSCHRLAKQQAVPRKHGANKTLSTLRSCLVRASPCRHLGCHDAFWYKIFTFDKLNQAFRHRTGETQLHYKVSGWVLWGWGTTCCKKIGY